MEVKQNDQRADVQERQLIHQLERNLHCSELVPSQAFALVDDGHVDDAAGQAALERQHLLN